MNKQSLKIYWANKANLNRIFVYNDNAKEYMSIQCIDDQLKVELSPVDLSSYNFEQFIQKKLQIEIILFTRGFYLLGAIRSEDGFRLAVLKGFEKIGTIVFNNVFKVTEVQFVSIWDSSQYHSKKSATQSSNFEEYFQSSLGKFLIAENYEIYNSYQQNYLGRVQETRLNFIINKKMLQNLNSDIDFQKQKQGWPQGNKWFAPLIIGHFLSQKTQSKDGHYKVVLLSRQEASNLGIQGNRKGLNQNAFSSSYFEIEQILIFKSNMENLNPIVSSFVQIRGSLPLYWHIEYERLNTKQKIVLNPQGKQQLGLLYHTNDLIRRYGNNIAMLSLLKQNTKEKKRNEGEISLFLENLANETFKNSNLSFEFIKFDINQTIKNFPWRIKQLLASNVNDFLIQNSFFYHEDETVDGIFSQIQKGVLRSSSSDCVDRVNTAQQIVSQMVLNSQIECFEERMERKKYRIKASSQKYITIDIQSLWTQLGDFLSDDITGTKAQRVTQKPSIAISVKRFLNSIFTDNSKQQYLDTLQQNNTQTESVDLSQELQVPLQQLYQMLENSFKNNQRFMDQLDEGLSKHSWVTLQLNSFNVSKQEMKIGLKKRKKDKVRKIDKRQTNTFSEIEQLENEQNEEEQINCEIKQINEKQQKQTHFLSYSKKYQKFQNKFKEILQKQKSAKLDFRIDTEKLKQQVQQSKEQDTIVKQDSLIKSNRKNTDNQFLQCPSLQSQSSYKTSKKTQMNKINPSTFILDSCSLTQLSQMFQICTLVKRSGQFILSKKVLINYCTQNSQIYPAQQLSIFSKVSIARDLSSQQSIKK